MQRLVRTIGVTVALTMSAALFGACGSESVKPPLWEPVPECEGEAIVALSGQHQMVISNLEIGELDDGFDLDRDGEPDNKLAAVRSLARSAIQDSFESFEIVIPMEFFDFETPGEDECVKFAIYVGQYRLDADGDGEETARERGDCNDHDPNINRNMPEIPGNYKDDNCDGLADETIVGKGEKATVVPSDDTEDRDGDGVTIADGDCDDTNPMVMGPTMPEVCGDGFDNNCDGKADWGVDGDGNPLCTPYDDTGDPDTIALDPLSFDNGGKPIIAFTSGTVRNVGGVLKLEAGPSIFSVSIPVYDDLKLDLRISGARIEADIVEMNGGWGLVNGRLGGVLDANTADKIRGLDVPEIGLLPEDSLLDATFANLLGPLLGLPALPDSSGWGGCRTPDIDVDQDGLEAFCDIDFTDDKQVVGVCIDGNGEAVYDELDANGNVIKHCSEATDSKGNLRFVDGISVEINFETVPVILPSSLE